MHETYLKEQPWIIMAYPLSDAEADARGGVSEIVFECCICGVRAIKQFPLPPAGDPVYENLDPEKGLPACYAMRRAFQLAHVHEDFKHNPILTWAKPLRNPAALVDGIDIAQLKERLTREITEAGT